MRSPEFLLVTAACSLSFSLGRADTFTVTTSASLGPGSLYEAIVAANAHPGLDTISFNLPGSGMRTINVGDNGLPEITDEVIIDGYTQPGAKPNTLSVGDNAVILVRLDGFFTPPAMPHSGLVLFGGNSLVRGLAFIDFPRAFDTGTTFEGAAIVLQDKGGNLIEGNFIGPTSNTGFPGENAVGVSLVSSNNIVGGTLPAARNIISLNVVGVSIESGATRNVVEGNYLGPDSSGTQQLGNGIAIAIDGKDNLIGGLSAAARNVISGNGDGVYIFPSGTGNVVENNFIGTDASGTRDLHNDNPGITISGSNNLIGGLSPGAANRILFGLVGVDVRSKDSDHPAIGNSIFSNTISSEIEIDLDTRTNPYVGLYDGPTPNDLGDGDSGPNELQNFPVISGISFAGDKTTVQGGLNSTPSTKFTLQFFTTGLQPSDNALLGTKTLTTNAAGIAYFSFDFQALPPDVAIAATATDAAGNTSEFSPAGAIPRLANISARGEVGQGDDLLVGGFILRTNGAGKERVLVRALGPSLAGDGAPLPGRLADPTLELRNGNGVLVGANDNWRSTQEAAIIATGNAPKSDKESALIANLSPGGYTVQVRGANGSTGIGVVEIYAFEPLDDQAQPRLKNISARATVGEGNRVLIGGLIVDGDAAEKVLVRAIGPDLAAFGVQNALQNPTLELRDAFGTLLGANDDWRSDQEDEIKATGLPPNDDRDAALISTLLPGAYTVIVRGVDESSGTGVVEIYDLSLPD